GFERAPEIILVQPRDDHAAALISQSVAGSRQVRIEELPLVDPDDLGIFVNAPNELCRAADILRGDSHVAVRDDMVLAEAIVENRLEDLHFLTCDLSASQSADELLALPAEHAPGDHFDPPSPKLFPDDVHDLTASCSRAQRRGPSIHRERCDVWRERKKADQTRD